MGGAEASELEGAKSVVQRLLNFRLPYDPRRAELYRHHIGRPEVLLYPDNKTRRNSIFLPYPYANVEHVSSSVQGSIFGFDPPFETLPRGASDGNAAFNMQKVLEKKVLQEGRFRPVFSEYLKGLCIYGFYPLYVGWDWDYDLVSQPVDQPQVGPDGIPIINPRTGMPNIQRSWQRVPVPRMRPKFECIDIFDHLVDPDGAYEARMLFKTLPQLIREQTISRIAVGKGICQNPLYSDDAIARIQDHVTRAFAGSNKADASNAIINICELWDRTNGTCTLLTMAEDYYSLAYKNQRYANRSAQYGAFRRATADVPSMLLAPSYDNPFAHCRVPILHTNYTQLPGEIFGMGVIEPSYLLNENANRFSGMLMDKFDLGVNTRLLVDNTRDLDFNELQENNVPGGVIPVLGDPNTVVKELSLGTPNQADYSMPEILKSLIEVTSGVSDFYSGRGGESAGNKTATGISSILGEASKRQGQLIMALTEDIIQPLLEMTASNIQQFCTDIIEVRITDENPTIGKVASDSFIKVTPADLAGSFDFRIVGSAYMENPVVLQRNIMALTNLIMTSGLAQYIKPYESLRELFRIFRIPYPNRIMLTEQEVQIQAAQQAAQAAAQQQQDMGDHLALQMLLKKLGLTPEQLKELAKEEGGSDSKGGGDKSRRPSQPEGKIPGATVTGSTRSQAQSTGMNALGLGGLSLESLGAGSR